VVSAVSWFEGDLEAALSEAGSKGKLVFVEVGAYWCPPCHRLDEETFTDADFAQRLHALAVPLHVDAEKGAGPEIVERYHVLAYPTMLMLEPSGVEKGRVVDFSPPAELADKLEALAEGGNVLAQLEAAAAAEPDDLEAAYVAGHAHALAAHKHKALAHYERVLSGDPDNVRGLASKVLYDRALFITDKLDDDPEGAIAAYEALQAKYPESPEATRAFRMIGRTLNGMGRADEAIARLDAMLEKDASSVGSYGWFCFRERCHPEKGLEVVTRALEDEALEAGARAELSYLQGELQHLVGDDAAAAVAMAKASELQPRSAFYKRMARRFAGGRGE